MTTTASERAPTKLKAVAETMTADEFLRVLMTVYRAELLKEKLPA
jgi:hypothetical protein